MGIIVTIESEITNINRQQVKDYTTLKTNSKIKLYNLTVRATRTSTSKFPNDQMKKLNFLPRESSLTLLTRCMSWLDLKTSDATNNRKRKVTSLEVLSLTSSLCCSSDLIHCIHYLQQILKDEVKLINKSCTT